MADLLLVLQELVADVGHGSGSTAVVVHYSTCHLLLRHLRVATRSHRDVERLHAFFERGAHTSTHLILLKVLLGRILVVQGRILNEAVTTGILVHVGRDLGRAQRRVILKLQRRLLLIFL